MIFRSFGRERLHMGLFRKLFGSTRSAAPRREPVFDIGQKPSLNPKFAGDMLIYQLLSFDEAQFGVSQAEYESLAADLPEEIRDNFKMWGTFYLAWRMRIGALHVYGTDFQAEMMDCAFTKLENARAVLDDFDVFIDTMRTCFALLDRVVETVAKDGYVVFNGIEVPFAYMAAIRFLTATKGLNAEPGEIKGDMELGMALAKLEEKTSESLPYLLKVSAEKLRD